MRRKCVLAAVALASSVFGTLSVDAAIIASDTFESYTAGNTVSGQNGGSGFSGAYVSDNTPSVNAATETLSYSSGVVTSTGGTKDLQVIATGSNTSGGVDSGALGRTFAAQTGTVYFSMLLRGTNTANNEFLQIGLNNATGTTPALSLGAQGASASLFNFFARPSASSGGTASTTLMNPNQTYLVVGKASISGAFGSDYDRLDLYVNPSSATEPGTSTVSSSGDSTLTSLSTLNLRIGRLATGDTFSIDNVRIGTTFADVLPEPASLGLLALVSTAFLARRRRAR